MLRFVLALASLSNVRGAMKSTYFLPGRYWDNKPLYFGKVEVDPATCCFGDLGSPISLFDMEGKRRQVLLSRLFTIDTCPQFAESMIDLLDCVDIGINIDYVPRAPIPVHWTFFFTRLLQMLGQLHEVVPKARLHILVSGSFRIAVFRYARCIAQITA